MKRALHGILVLAIYAGVVVWLTWPLASRLTSHLPMTSFTCTIDNYLIGWALAHESRALSEDLRALPHGNIFHPSSHALLYGEPAFGALPYFIGPFLLSGNPTLALNLLFLGCTVLTAWAVHLATVAWTTSHLSGFLAAWTYLTSHWLLWRWVPSAPNYAVLQYLPVIIVLAAETNPRPRRDLGLLVLVILQGLVSVYIAAATLIPLIIIGLGRLVRPATRAAGLRLLGALTGASVALALAYSGHLLVRLENADLGEQSVWAHVGNPTVTSLPWDLFHPMAVLSNPMIPFVVIGSGLAVFILRARWRDKRARVPWIHGTFWVVTGLFLSLQPTVEIWGQQITLPQAYVWPWIRAVTREVARLAIPAHIAVALLTGVAFAECVQWLTHSRPRLPGAASQLGRTLLAVLIALAIYGRYARGIQVPGIDARLPDTYPLRETPGGPSAIMRELQRPGGPLLELPIGPGERSHTAAMYRSIFHRRPILNGYNGYWPAGFPERMALACALPDLAALNTLRRETGLEMVLLHLTSGGLANLQTPGPYGCAAASAPASETELRSRRAEQVARWMQVVSPGFQGQFELILRDGDDWLLRVRDAPMGP